LMARAVRLNRFLFNSTFDSEGAETFRLYIDLIKCTIWFNRKPSQQSWKSYCNRWIGKFSRGIHQDVRYNWQNHLWLNFLLFFFFYNFFFNFFKIFFQSNQIQANQILEKNSIRSAYNSIQFEPKHSHY
jgi:hypothetical protein